MKAVTLTGPGRFGMVDRPAPEAGAQAIVAIEQVGLCGTDLKIHGGDIPVEYPRVLGHEIVGRLVAPGSRGLLAPGTRVLVDPAVACHHCRECRADRPNLCPNGALLGRDLDGGLVEAIAVDELQLHPLADSLSPATTSVLQVLGTCVHAQRITPPAGRGLAVVVGLGVAGLLHLQLLRRAGREVIGITRSAAKRDLAERFGAVAVGDPESAEDLVRVRTAGAGAALVVEAIGSVETLALAVRLAAPGAVITQYGTITETSDRAVMPWYELYHKELRIVNPRAALGRDYRTAIAMAEAAELDLDVLWSGSYALADVATAFGAIGPGSPRVKVTIDV